MILLKGIPLPPTTNLQYSTFVKNGRIMRVKAKDSVAYQKEFYAWASLKADDINKAKSLLNETMELKIRANFFFSKDRLYTKKGKIKRLDVSNRVKLLHDCLADVLEIDDSQFFLCIETKVPVYNDACEQVIVSIDIHQ